MKRLVVFLLLISSLSQASTFKVPDAQCKLWISINEKKHYMHDFYAVQNVEFCSDQSCATIGTATLKTKKLIFAQGELTAVDLGAGTLSFTFTEAANKKYATMYSKKDNAEVQENQDALFKHHKPFTKTFTVVNNRVASLGNPSADWSGIDCQ